MTTRRYQSDRDDQTLRLKEKRTEMKNVQNYGEKMGADGKAYMHIHVSK